MTNPNLGGRVLENFERIDCKCGANYLDNGLRKMTKEISMILELIESFDENMKTSEWTSDNTIFQKSLICINILSLIATLLFVFVKSFQVYAWLPAVILAIAFLLLIFSWVVALVRDVRNPLKGYAKAGGRRFEAYSDFKVQLSRFGSANLDATKKFIEKDTLRIRTRLQRLVGAVESAGYIPAALALYFAASQVVSDKNASPSILLMAFVLGLYIGAYLGHRIIERMNFYIECLQEAYEIAVKEESIF